MLFTRTTTRHDVLCAPCDVELAANLVLVALDELGDHGPDHVELLALARRHRLSKILQLFLGLLELLADLIDDLWQIVLDVSEQYAGQLRRKCLTTKVTGRHG